MGSFSLPAKFIFTLLTLTFLLTQASPTPNNLDLSDYNALFHLTKSLNYQINRSSNICNSAEFHCEAGISTTVRLTRIVLVSKQLTGSLSPQIGRLTELKELSLLDNDLVDRMPHQIVDCKQLEVLNLRNNRLSGQIPQEFASLVRLKTLDLSFNRFSGNLNFLKHFPNLETLYLSNNLFSGKIPVSLRNFRNLRFLNVSGNAGLQGSLPRLQQTGYSSSLPKRYIFAENVTRNNTTKSATVGVSPSPSPSPLPAPRKHKKSDHKNLKGWIIGFFAGLVAGMISGFIFSVLFKLVLTCIRGRVKESGPVIYSQLIKKAEDLAFLEQENGVDSLETIGRGGCGEVYRKAIYGDEGKIFAIKKINQPSGNGSDQLSEEDTKLLSKKMRQVRSEINTVGEIRHRNLLPLLAHVPRPDCHYLVYEFMKNGSLHDMLKRVSEGNAELDWSVRHNIAIGVAAGLEYLHMHRSPRIIHRDLKPANILLDDDMEARIADFGLAAAMPDANTHVTTSIVAGTVGYIAPEYHQTLKFTDKCDVYSFGVVLAVLVMGKFPSDDFFQNTDEMSLVKWLRNVMMSADPSRAIDRKLIGQGHDEQLLLVLKIAWFCTMDDPKQRPNSKDVHRMLTQVKH